MKGSVDGLILRESVGGESDKLLTVLTAEHGRISIKAKGVRSVKSKSAPLCRLFTYGNFEYYEKNGMRWLSGGSIIESFFGLNSDLEDFALATYVADVACELSDEGVRADGLLRVVLNTLYAIEKKLKQRELVKGAFELYAANSAGFSPNLSDCRDCGGVGDGTFYLDVMNGSLVCSECIGKGRAAVERGRELDAYEARNIFLPVSRSVIAAARYVSSADPARIFSFELRDPCDLADFSRIGETYLQNHLERGFDTLDFYKQITKFDDRLLTEMDRDGNKKENPENA